VARCSHKKYKVKSETIFESPVTTLPGVLIGDNFVSSLLFLKFFEFVIRTMAIKTQPFDSSLLWERWPLSYIKSTLFEQFINLFCDHS